MHEVIKADSNEDDEAEKNEEDEPDEYRCIYCRTMFPNQEHLMHHLGRLKALVSHMGHWDQDGTNLQ